MKTLSFLLFVVIFAFAGCSKNDDILLQTNDDLQLKSAENGNYTEQFYFNPGPEQYYLPIICDGQEVDALYGDENGVTVHVIIHYKNHEFDWDKMIVKGNLTSETTGETFTTNEFQKSEFNEEGRYSITFHTNAIGNMGTHYLISATVLWNSDFTDLEWIDIKAMCVPNKK